MPHCIEAEDIVLSDSSTEWHKLAKVGPINDDTVKDLLFPINVTEDVQIGGITIPDKIGLIADLSDRGRGLLPLDIHTKTYRPISNREVWEAIKNGLRGIDHTVATAGTLGNCRRFFISVQIKDNGRDSFNVCDQKHLAYENFVTSHDGSLSFWGYSSDTKVVCQNTLNYSFNNKKGGLCIKHTKNADVEISGLEEWLHESFRTREEYKVNLERLAEIKIDRAEATVLTAGYFFLRQNGEGKFSDRTKKDVKGIVDLFETGAGNDGKTAYSLLNGATDHWTNGRGAGIASAPAAKRLSASQFGAAARHKSLFASTLVSRSGYQSLQDAGKEAVSLLA